MDRLSCILGEVKDGGGTKKGTIWRDDKEVEWRAYNEDGIIHIVIEKEECSIERS